MGIPPRQVEYLRRDRDCLPRETDRRVVIIDCHTTKLSLGSADEATTRSRHLVVLILVEFAPVFETGAKQERTTQSDTISNEGSE